MSDEVKPIVVVYCEGGVVQAIHSQTPIKVIVQDADEWGCMNEAGEHAATCENGHDADEIAQYREACRLMQDIACPPVY